MRCEQCGNELVRGFSYCLECGLPVPDEMLEESGLPLRNIDSGPKTRGVGESAERVDETNAAASAAKAPEEIGELKPQYVGGGGSDEDRGSALKPQYIGGDSGVGGAALKPTLMGHGDENSGTALKPQYIGGGNDDKGQGEQVQVVLRENSSAIDGVTEKLVFCPNCGMHMQQSPNICDICGMLLGSKPTNVPKASSGMPLFNTDGDAFSAGFGGLGGFGGVEGLSDDDISGAAAFASGNNDPMFNNSAVGLGSLSEQLAGFSAAAESRSIGVTENTRVRQIAPEKGKDMEVSDFLLMDDLSSESVPMSTEGVPVVGDYAMEDDPNDDLDLDPFRFVGMSMDENPDEPFVKKRPGYGASSAAFERKATPVSEDIAPMPAAMQAPEPEPITPIISDINPIEQEPAPAEPQAAPALENIAPALESIAPSALEDIAPAVAEKAEEKAPEAPEEPRVEEIQPNPPQFAQMPRKRSADSVGTKKCYACGHMMPAVDKFCPNCGRSTFGAPNPELAAREQANTPKPKKRSVLPFVLILIIAVAAAIIGTMYFTHSGIFESMEGLPFWNTLLEDRG